MQPDEYQVGDLLAILDIARRLVEQHQIEPLLNYIAEHALNLIGAERCYIVLFDADGTPQFRVTRNRQGQSIDIPSDQISHTILMRVRETGTPLILADALGDSQFSLSSSVRNLGLRSVICVPLISYGTAIGAVYLENRSVAGLFSNQHLPIMLLYANQASVAVENASAHENLERRVDERTRALLEANWRLQQQANNLRQQMSELEALRDQLRELSTRDSLTGLHNRRYLLEVITQQLGLAQRYRQHFSTAILDLDHFKSVNDRFTHLIGDQVLRKVSDLLRTHTRSVDTVARYGGEEFVIILPETPLTRAFQLCERLREAIEQFDWKIIHPQLHVTTSIGVASSEAITSMEDLLRLADDRLFEAKRAGRNQTIAG